MPAMVTQELAGGVVLFRRAHGHDRQYLVLRSAHKHWEFAKGHLQHHENWREAALRELTEEAGINDAVVVPGFARMIRYFFRDRHRGLVQKTVAFLLAETMATTTTLSQEHTHGEFLPFTQAHQTLTHAGTRAILRDAESFLSRSDNWHP